MNYKVYALVNPLNEDVIYIGATSLSLTARLLAHKYSIKIGCGSPIYRYVSEFGIDPKIVTIQEGIGFYPAARLLKNNWINHYRKIGHPIQNVRAGISQSEIDNHIHKIGFPQSKNLIPIIQ